jgi:hypothetical protein
VELAVSGLYFLGVAAQAVQVWRRKLSLEGSRQTVGTVELALVEI